MRNNDRTADQPEAMKLALRRPLPWMLVVFLGLMVVVTMKVAETPGRSEGAVRLAVVATVGVILLLAIVLVRWWRTTDFEWREATKDVRKWVTTLFGILLSAGILQPEPGHPLEGALITALTVGLLVAIVEALNYHNKA